ncbi:response regulator [Cohnella sp. GCM10012308]|uniref:response regulator n=1 Tax=Cohnella sp. GCM10012308 TaxID=3317329 RepID=UPI003608E6C2
MRDAIACLIVDDEPPMVQRLTRMFERWAERRLPYKLVGTACSGDEGLEKAALLKPDLILTDVVMPGKNGLEMIKALRESHPRIEFIVLSAYSDFAYAKQAIAMGVFEYLVKVPLREQEVLAALDKARDNMMARGEKERTLHSLSGSVKGDAHRMRKQLFEELARGERSAASMEKASLPYAPGFRTDRYACFAVRLDDYAAFCEAFAPADRQSLRYGMMNIIEEVLQASGGCFVFEWTGDTLFGFAMIQETGELGYENRGVALGEEIVGHVKTYLRLSVSVGVSRRYGGWERAEAAFREAQAAVTDAFYSSFGTVVTPNRRPFYDAADAQDVFDRFEVALERVSSKADRDELAPLLKLLHAHRISPDKLVPFAERWLARLERKLLQSGHDPQDEPKLRPDACMHLHQFADRLREQWDRILSRTEAPSLRPDMAKAILYVEDHLSEPLSLGQLADYIHLNPTYVSELFKKELGVNFTDYVAKRRIERAIALMRKRAYTNQELAEAVGIQNEKYFCTLFKKMTGTSPQKYETGGRRNEEARG